MQLIFSILPDNLPEKDINNAFSPEVDDVRGMQFSGQNLQKVDLRGCDVDQCRFSNAGWKTFDLVMWCLNPAIFPICNCLTVLFTGWLSGIVNYPVLFFPVPCFVTQPFSMWWLLIPTLLEATGKIAYGDPVILLKLFLPNRFSPLWCWRKAV